MSGVPTSTTHSTEFVSVDAEHRVQIELMDALCRTLSEGADRTAVAESLDQLVTYTDAHFTGEQLLMRQHAYPHFEAHELEHERMVEQVHELRRKFQLGEIPLTLEAAQSLRAWLIRHIEGSDQALGSYLEEQGAGEVK